MHVDAVPMLAGAVMLIAGVALGVCLLSARRVSAVDPVVALRAE
jgi:hypothetical protein